MSTASAILAECERDPLNADLYRILADAMDDEGDTVGSLRAKALARLAAQPYRTACDSHPAILAAMGSCGVKTVTLVANLTAPVVQPEWDEGNKSVRFLVALHGTASPQAVISDEIARGTLVAVRSWHRGRESMEFHGHPCDLLTLVKQVPETELLPWNVEVVLSATRSLKSSYGGIKDFRFYEAQRQAGISRAEWDQGVESCKAKKLLDARGAITTQGRNAIGTKELYELRPVQHASA